MFRDLEGEADFQYVIKELIPNEKDLLGEDVGFDNYFIPGFNLHQAYEDILEVGYAEFLEDKVWLADFEKAYLSYSLKELTPQPSKSLRL